MGLTGAIPPGIIEGMIGTTVGSYCVTEKLSVGGMGTVYKAEHTLIGKLAAVKVLHPELCYNREIVSRFFNEAKATTQIKHPGIVEIFDFGYLPSGDAFIVMEFLEGMSLARRLETRGRMDEGEAAMLLKSICSALGAAHAKNIVHRDLKPDNIFLCPDPESPTGERPKLLDFGIAKLTDVGPATMATKTGAVMGTPTYMSPEQCKGTGGVDLRSDLYSLGCIFYELVCGRPPFVEQGAGELIGAHLFLAPESPRKHRPEISLESEALIMALLAKNPAQRPQTTKELGQRLTAVAQKHGWITPTNPTGVTAESLRPLVPLTEPELTAQGSTPGSTPSTGGEPARSPGTDPTVAAAPGALPSPSSSVPYRTASPTTLSGAASVSAAYEVPPRSRRTIWMALGAAALVGGMAIGLAVVRGGESSSSTTSSATTPGPQPSTVSAQQPIAHPESAVKPAPVVPTEPVAKPEPAVVPSVKTDPVVKTEPAVPVAPVVKAAATTKGSTRATTKADKAKKPDKTKVDKPADGSGAGSAKILIETDI